MSIKASTLLGVGRDDDRVSPGFNKATGDLYGGMLVTQDNSQTDGKTIKAFAGQTAISATNPFPLGLVFESNVIAPIANTSGITAGLGFNIQDYAKGGVSNYSVFHRPGNFVDVYDDGRNSALLASFNDNSGVAVTTQPASCPFLVTNNWALGDSVYAIDAAGGRGRLTNDGTTAKVRVGTVRAVSGTGATAILCIELHIVAL